MRLYPPAVGPFKSYRMTPMMPFDLLADRPSAVNLTPDEVRRYARHLIMPEVAMDGQKRLKASRVLCIGTGGLGSPLTLYLAAAGVGTIGLVDFDVVDLSNLQRQIIHTTADIGRPKIASAEAKLKAINPDLNVVRHEYAVDSSNALGLFADYDVIVDGTDNFPTRYLVNDACVLTGKPNVYGSIFRFDGQASVFFPPQARATDASTPSRRRRTSSRTAPRGESWASCPGSSAWCRRRRP